MSTIPPQPCVAPLPTVRRRRPGAGPVASAALTMWALAPVVYLLAEASRRGLVVSGTDGALAGADQLFYMDSIRQSGEHVLIGDNFDLTLGGQVFLHPLYLLGGILWRLGVSIQATFWLLSVLAAPVLGFGAAAVVAHALRSARERLVALGVSLFYLSPLVPLLAWAGGVSPFQRFELDFPVGESMPAWQLWGYPHAAIAVGLMAASVAGALSLAARPRGQPWLVAGIAAAAALTAWLHPWQGATLIVVLAAIAARDRSPALARALSVPVLAGVAPLAYEGILSRADPAWRLDATRNAVGHVPTWMAVVALAPLVLPALAGIRATEPGPLRAALVAWPASALAIYAASDTFPYHALQGISIPLSVLAVLGWRSLPGPARVRGAAGVAAAALAIAAGVAYGIGTGRDSVRAGVAPYWLDPGERAALSYLDHARLRGGVVARYYLGMAVPAFTGRRTWMGEWTWTPDFARRQALTEQLFAGAMAPAQARALVVSTGARFALTDCGARADLSAMLGRLVLARHRFGCAAVYELRAERRAA